MARRRPVPKAVISTGDASAAAAQRAEQREVVHVWQSEVEHHGVEGKRRRGDDAKRRSGVGRLFDVDPEIRERFCDRPANQRLIIDDQHMARELFRAGRNFPRRFSV